MEFHCQPHLVKDLQVYAKKMEAELEEWKEEVRNARNEFYELNYYTTHQLLVLRSELGKLKAPVPALYHTAQVMALLQSISCDITPNDVETVVANERQKIIEGKKPHETATVDTMEFSSSSSYEPPPVPPPKTDLSGETSHREEDVSAKRAMTKLSVSDLDMTQKEHFTNLTEGYRYPEQFALKAIEECGSGNWIEIEDWVQENEAMVKEMLQNSGDEDSEGGDHEEDEEEMGQESMANENESSEKSKEDEIMYEVSPPGTYMID